MKKIYTLLILILAFFSFNCRFKAISNITINNYSLSPVFDIDTKVYNVFVSSKTEIITINVASLPDEVVTGAGSISLKKGLNEIEILVYKEDQVVDSYLLNITRGEVTFDKSIATLKNISVENHELDFRSDIYSYNIEVSADENRLNINYETTSPTSNVKMTGDVNLNKERNIINLIVTSEDKKNTKTYTLKVLKNQEDVILSSKKTSVFDDKEFSKYELKLIIAGIVFVGFVILSIIFYFLFIKNRKVFCVRFKNINFLHTKKD